MASSRRRAPNSANSKRAYKRIQWAYHIIRVILVILLGLIFLVSLIYFIKAIDAIGDDVEQARETHWGHEVEESDLIGHRVLHPDEIEENTDDSTTDVEKLHNRPEEEDDFEVNIKHPSVVHRDPRGRLITGHHHFTVTKSDHKQHHIVSLIIWVVLTLFCAILSMGGIIGVFCDNACLVCCNSCVVSVQSNLLVFQVIFSTIMIFVHAIFSHILPYFNIQLPSMTSNWFLMALEAPAILLAIVYVVLYRAKKRANMNWNQIDY